MELTEELLTKAFNVEERGLQTPSHFIQRWKVDIGKDGRYDMLDLIEYESRWNGECKQVRYFAFGEEYDDEGDGGPPVTRVASVKDLIEYIYERGQRLYNYKIKDCLSDKVVALL